MKKELLLAGALFAAGCGMNVYHITDTDGIYLGTVAIGKQTLDGGSVAFTKDTWDKEARHVDGSMAVGPGILPAIIQAGGMVGAANQLGTHFPKNVGDNIGVNAEGGVGSAQANGGEANSLSAAGAKSISGAEAVSGSTSAASSAPSVSIAPAAAAPIPEAKPEPTHWKPKPKKGY